MSDSVAAARTHGRRIERDGRSGVGRLVVVPAAVGVVAMLGLLSSCVPVLPPADLGLHASIGDGGILLEWRSADAAPAGYEVQMWRRDEPVWTTVASVPGTSMDYAEVVDRTAYHFRVRVAASPSRPAGAWTVARSVSYVTPTLPVVRIQTDGAAPIVGTDDYVSGQVSLDPNGSDGAAYTGRMQIKGRGNSTSALPKKPYKIKLDKKAPLMGMPPEKDWVLLANYRDKSQLRTFAATELGHATDLAWTPHMQFVEVFLNDTYVRVYQLAEQVEVSERRVDVDPMEPTDVAGEELTGGYLLEVDQRLEENHEIGFRTSRQVPVVVKDPEPPSTEQYNFIRSYVQAFENSLYSPGFADPVDGYRQFLDVDSLVDWYLVQELTRNQDAFFSSTYMVKPRGERLQFGPIWDFDLSMGTETGVVDGPPEGWWLNRQDVVWLPRLFDDPNFVQRVATRWNELSPSFAQLPDRLDIEGAALHDAILNDQVPWDYTLGATDETAWVSGWLRARIAWMDAQFAPAG